MDNFIANLFGLEDIIIKNVSQTRNEISVDIELPRRPHTCPCCGNATDTVHDYRHQKVRDLPAFGKQVSLILRKRRYVCKACGKRFFEKNTFLPRYYRSTQRKIIHVINGFREQVSATHIARENGISVTTALRYFDHISYGSYRLPKVLSIDEFKGNAGGEKYQCIVADPQHHIILDILPSRKSADLTSYFLAFPRKSRLQVKCVVMDMSNLFRGVIQACFPNAAIIADRYHVIRQAIWAFENVRKNEQKKLSPEWRKFCKRSKTLLNKLPDSLSSSEEQQVRIILGTSERLCTAYYLKNDFVNAMHTKEVDVARRKLGNWLYQAERSNLKEFKACTIAVHNWYTEITNSFVFPYTNGFTEGCNNKTKVIKRVCFGVRNFRRFRNRILHCSHI